MSSIPANFTGGATTSVRYDLLDHDDQLIGPLDGVIGGSLQWSAATQVKAGGSIDVIDIDDIDWLTARIQIWRTIGTTTWSRGIYIPTAPEEKWVGSTREWKINILGKLSLLEQDEVETWVSFPAGTPIITAVKELLEQRAHTNTRITESTATLRTSMTWEPGTKLLTIINELLAATGYWALSADDDGAFSSEPYTRPAARPIRYNLHDDDKGIYRPEFTHDHDIYAIPNRVILISQSAQDTPPLVGIAENTNPDNPFSISARGQVISYQESGIEVTSQSAINELARKKLIEKSSVSASLAIQHAPLPLDLNDAVSFRRIPAGIAGAYTVQSITESLDPLALMQTTLREVVDI